MHPLKHSNQTFTKAQSEANIYAHGLHYSCKWFKKKSSFHTTYFIFAFFLLLDTFAWLLSNDL